MSSFKYLLLSIVIVIGLYIAAFAFGQQVFAKGKTEVPQEVHILLTGQFNSNMYEALAPKIKAAKDSSIILHVQSPGGYTNIMADLAVLLLDHPKSVVAVVHGYAYSAAAVILLSADFVILTAGADVMYHMPYRRAKSGAIIQMRTDNTKGAQHEFVKSFIKAVQKSKCFLTGSQFKSFIGGNDEYVYADTMTVYDMSTCDYDTDKDMPVAVRLVEKGELLLEKRRNGV